MHDRFFQKTTNLPVSGKLDLATLAMMNKRRCGVKDSFNERSLNYRIMGRWLSISRFWHDQCCVFRHNKFKIKRRWTCKSSFLPGQVTGVRRCWPTASIITLLTWDWLRPDRPSSARLSTGVTFLHCTSGRCSKEEQISKSYSTAKTRRVRCHLMAEVGAVEAIMVLTFFAGVHGY